MTDNKPTPTERCDAQSWPIKTWVQLCLSEDEMFVRAEDAMKLAEELEAAQRKNKQLREVGEAMARFIYANKGAAGSGVLQDWRKLNPMNDKITPH